jgi:hypothetical protein
LDELKTKGIHLTDAHARTDDIDVLIGLDLINQMETGRRVTTAEGLVAVEYVFGWTLRGPIPHYETNTSMLVSSLHIDSAPVHKLWDLDLLGIYDPAFQTTKDEKEALAKKHFLDNVKRKKDGRYSVALPWIGDVQEIPSEPWRRRDSCPTQRN